MKSVNGKGHKDSLKYIHLVLVVLGMGVNPPTKCVRVRASKWVLLWKRHSSWRSFTESCIELYFPLMCQSDGVLSILEFQILHSILMNNMFAFLLEFSKIWKLKVSFVKRQMHWNRYDPPEKEANPYWSVARPIHLNSFTCLLT